MEEITSNFIHDIIDADLKEKPDTKIHTRFPPEPNGYLHIGSAKAILINYETAKKYGGVFNLRYDDTNPSKEDTEYVDSIYQDLMWLGAEPSGGIFYGSDYFDKCYEYAEKLIMDGKAYVCDLSAEEMKELPSILARRGEQEAKALCAALGKCLKEFDYWAWNMETLKEALGSYGAYLET